MYSVAAVGLGRQPQIGTSALYFHVFYGLEHLILNTPHSTVTGCLQVVLLVAAATSNFDATNNVDDGNKDSISRNGEVFSFEYKKKNLL